MKHMLLIMLFNLVDFNILKPIVAVCSNVLIFVDHVIFPKKNNAQYSLNLTDIDTAIFIIRCPRLCTIECIVLYLYGLEKLSLNRA